MDKETAKYYMIIGLVALTTLALGVFAFNEVIGLYYKIELLRTPCELCVELNPEWAKCYDYLTTPVPIPQNYSLPNINFSQLLSP